MGCGASKISPEDAAEAEGSKQIQAWIQAEEHLQSSQLKLLWLGPTQSGKSATMKQMKFALGPTTLPDEERKCIVPNVRKGMFSATLAVGKAMSTLGIEFQTTSAQEAWSKLEANPVLQEHPTPGMILDQAVVSDIVEFSQDGGVVEAIQRGNEYRLDDSAAHFLKNAKLICSDAYVPDIDMLVRSHVEQTQGVETYECTMKNQTSVHIDVSGQHNEMKKWIRLYQGLTGVVFVADICAYDQVTQSGDNVMDAQIEYFGEILIAVAARLQTPLVLLLNKVDLLEERLKRTPLSPKWKPEGHGAPGGTDKVEAIEYIKTQFLQQKPEGFPDEKLSVHAISAVEKGSVDTVMSEVIGRLVEGNLEASGFLE